VRVELPPGTRELLLRATCGPLMREVTLELPPPPHGTGGARPAVQALALDGDRLVVHPDAPADGLRLRGPHTDVPVSPQRERTVVVDLRRDLYGRQVWLPDRALPPRAAGRPDRGARLAGTPAGRGRRRPSSAPRPPPRDGPGELHLGPPRADDELGAYSQEQLRASYAV